MPQITAIPAFSDNYIWLVQYQSLTACVDPGEAAPVIDYLHQHELHLNEIWLTHHHHDHTGGVAELIAQFPDCKVYGHENFSGVTHPINLEHDDSLALGDVPVAVWHTPGHTDTHLSYLMSTTKGIHVFCGDTLFSGGCGRVFTGTIEELFHSLQRYLHLPDDTLFYPAHEYTAANLRFAQYIEPDNKDVAAALQAAAKIPTLPVSLEHEKKVNPFLRTAFDSVQKRVKLLANLPDDADEVAIFAALRELKNTF